MTLLQQWQPDELIHGEYDRQEYEHAEERRRRIVREYLEEGTEAGGRAEEELGGDERLPAVAQADDGAGDDSGSGNGEEVESDIVEASDAGDRDRFMPASVGLLERAHDGEDDRPDDGDDQERHDSPFAVAEEMHGDGQDRECRQALQDVEDGEGGRFGPAADEDDDHYPCDDRRNDEGDAETGGRDAEIIERDIERDMVHDREDEQSRERQEQYGESDGDVSA